MNNETTTSTPQPRPSRTRDVAVAMSCGFFVAAMVGAAYAAVPLYDWFCRVTGFNGTTQVATQAPGTVLERTIKVRFDGNVAPGLPWRFEPEQNEIEVKVGDVVTVNYRVINAAARETTGVASYNVTPLNFGGYFQKINCFCFSEQTLKAGEKREMAVVFFVDPAIEKDTEADNLNTITLSYTFFPQREPQRSTAESAKPGNSGRI